MRNFIICLKHGNKYGPEYVNTLESMVRRNCTMSFEFVCFTDDPKGINSTVRTMPLSNAYGVAGWWHKPLLFNPDNPVGIRQDFPGFRFIGFSIQAIKSMPDAPFVL